MDVKTNVEIKTSSSHKYKQKLFLNSKHVEASILKSRIEACDFELEMSFGEFHNQLESKDTLNDERKETDQNRMAKQNHQECFIAGHELKKEV